MIASYVLALIFVLRLWSGSHENVPVYLRSRYGLNALRFYRQWEKTLTRSKKVELDLKFLECCKIYNVIPKFLRFKLHRRVLTSAAFYKSWQSKLLINEINCKKRSLDKYQGALTQHEGALSNVLSSLDMFLVRNHLRITVAEFEASASARHENKLIALGVRPRVEPCDPSSVIYNFSDVTIPERVRYLLAFGLDFGLPVFRLNFVKHFHCFEKLSNYFRNVSTSDDHKNLCRALKHVSHKFFYNFKPSKIFSIFSKNDIRLLKCFSTSNDIIVSKPDKGRGVVVVNKQHYIDGVKKIITNNSKFDIVQGDIKKFSLQLEDRINHFLSKLKTLGHISQSLYNQLRVTGSGPGILYGLPKVHKPNFEAEMLYRPIFAAYNCASYNISKFLVQILTPYAENQYTIKNSVHFKEQIENIPDSNHLIMASFDIKDLYTNIPLRETIDICMAKIDSSLFNIPTNLFRKMLELSVFNTFFLFDGNYYKQTDGLGMGLPLSPTLANIFLSHHEVSWLNECPLDFKPIFYRRYVDDTFAIFRRPDQAANFLAYLNSKHTSMAFTLESEVNGQLSFLDCVVSRGNNKFCTSVFRKGTFTGLGLSYFSFSPMLYKINSMKTLIFRAYKLSSSFTFLNKEFSFLVEYFYRNGYSKNIVYREINKFIRKIQNPTDTFQTVPKLKFYVSMPYYGSYGEKMKKEVTDLVEKIYPQVELSLALVNPFTIGSLFPYKDRLPKMMRSSIIYKYCCAHCASGTYVGSTTRAAYMRISEHRGRSYRTNLLLKTPQASSIREHALKCKQGISDDEFSILAQEGSSEINLRILESLFIMQGRPSLNDMQSAYPLNIAR